MDRKKQTVEVRLEDGRTVAMKQSAHALYRYLRDVRHGQWTCVWDCIMAVKQTDVRKRASELSRLCLIETRLVDRRAEYRVAA